MPTFDRRTMLRLGAAALAAPLPLHRAEAQALRDANFITPFGNIIAYAPDSVAASGGHFERNGLRVRIVGGSGSATAVQQVVAGQALIGRTGGIDVIKAVATVQAPMRAIATIEHSSTFHVISPAAAPIRTPADMRGKTIGIVSAGGGTENYLDIMLTRANIPRDSVTRQVVGNSPGAFEMTQLGRINGFIADLGVVVNLRARNLPIHVFNVTEYSSVPGQVYIASDRAIAENRNELLSYLRAIKAAMQEIIADTSGDATLRHLRPFNLQELNEPEIAKATVRGASELWRSGGEANMLKIVPASWRTGWQEMVTAGIAPAGDADRAFTTALSDAL
jgi:ABC-type nitrate/sulfonate/bicarbonate transport system substrate-binding protein